MKAAERAIDAAFVFRAQTGDPAAFDELIRRHDAPVRYYVRRLVGRDGPSDDVMQEVWLAALRQIGAIRNGGSFRVWLCRTARNLCASHVRAQTANKPFPLDTVDEPSDHTDLAPGHLGAAAVHAAILTLSVEHREVISLRFVQELSYEQIAEVQGCPVGTVRSRLHYAKKELLTALHPGPNGQKKPSKGVAL